MIKNRESAARSRARKQECIFLSFFLSAITLSLPPSNFCFLILIVSYLLYWLLQAYTTELEQEVMNLQQENERLKKQQEEVNEGFPIELFQLSLGGWSVCTGPF